MGKRHDELVRSLTHMARRNTGIALIETWKCEGCGLDCIYFHPMEESFACPRCGHRHASKFARYPTACEAGADAEVAFREPPADKQVKIW